MLSRFSFCGGQGLVKSVLKFQPASASVYVSQDLVKRENSSAPSKYPPEYPPAGDQRDYVNFPRIITPERPPPVRLGFIPDSWFQLFYPKTGYTGPYMFIASVGTYLYSKEIIVHDHNLLHFYSFLMFVIFIHMKFGDKIAALHDKLAEENIKELDESQESEKQYVKNQLEKLTGMQNIKSAIVEVTKARTELVQMQMEIAFRERLSDAYKKVKSRLDCLVELDNVEKRMFQKNLVDYVMRNVMKSVTPELENATMQKCISDLNNLAAKA